MIEFAVCMPVLIILLYYINDLSKLKRYYDQTEFVAQQMVNILQNIAHMRLQQGKTISVPDIRRAFGLAWLNVYPGVTMFYKGSGHELFHMPRVYIYYVKGEPEGKASVKWGIWLNTLSATAGTWNSNVLSASESGSTNSSVKWGTNVDPANIYPTLRIEEGKAKIILAVHLRWEGNNLSSKGEKAGSAREVFKLFAANPKVYGNMTYFPAVVTFTPNDGFTETRPQ